MNGSPLLCSWTVSSVAFLYKHPMKDYYSSSDFFMSTSNLYMIATEATSDHNKFDGKILTWRISHTAQAFYGTPLAPLGAGRAASTGACASSASFTQPTLLNRLTLLVSLFYNLCIFCSGGCSSWPLGSIRQHSVFIPGIAVASGFFNQRTICCWSFCCRYASLDGALPLHSPRTPLILVFGSPPQHRVAAGS
jgi:hypothetical protein